MSSMTGGTGYKGATGNSLAGDSSGYYKEKIPSGYKKGKIQQYTPEQLDLFRSLFSHLSPDSYLSKLAGGDEETFNQVEAPALRQFNELQGGLASRFSGMGMGARKSSGFQNTANAAASDFAQQLQSQRQNLQRQALQDLMGLSSNLLQQRPYEQFLKEKQKSGFGGTIGAALGGLGGFALGGPGGAMAGSQLGYGLGSSF